MNEKQYKVRTSWFRPYSEVRTLLKLLQGVSKTTLQSMATAKISPEGLAYITVTSPQENGTKGNTSLESNPRSRSYWSDRWGKTS